MRAARSDEPKAIAYLLYGDARHYERELAFSALGALGFLRDDPRGIRLCLVTDRPELQFELGWGRIALDPAELAEWTRDGRCIHRAKLFALQKALSELKMPVALVDTDTCFIDHPAKLFEHVGPGRSVMHAYEYAIDQTQLWWPLLAALGDREYVSGYRVAGDSPMFNSGVIGLHPQDAGLIQGAVALLDALDEITPVFNAEQFAIGTVLRQHTDLETAERVVRHYWGFERGFVHLKIARLLRGFRPERVGELANAAVQTELGFPARRLSHRILSRWKAKLHGWDRDCRFGYLAFLCALDWAHDDREMANVWLETALEALTLSKNETNTAARQRSSLRRSFKSLDPRSERWVDPGLALRWREFWAA
jgi:hypothetical protein